MNFGDIETLSTGERFVPVKTEEGKPVFYQLNNIKVNSVGDDNTVSLAIGESSLEHEGAAFDYVVQNSQALFGREVNKKSLEKAFVPSVDENEFCAEQFMVDGVVATRRYTQTNDRIEDPQPMEKGLHYDMVVELQGVWFLRKNFGTRWRLVQVRDCPPPPPKNPYDEFLFQ